MKLWVKIFLCSMTLIIIAINLTALFTLSENNNLTIKREENKSILQHGYICSVVSSNAVYERLKKGSVLLAEEQTAKIISETISGSNISDGISVYDGKKFLSGSKDNISQNTDIIESVEKNKESYTVKITDIDGTVYILVGSSLKLEGNSYTIISATNITDIYTILNEQINFVCIASLIFAIVISAVLLIIVMVLFRPLNKINTAINKIAGGDYSIRLEEKGGQELKTLSLSINTMTESIEENFNKVNSIAESRKRFIDNLSHEMKTPLTSILGFSDILRIKRNISDEQRTEYAGIIFEETKRLQTLSGKLMELVTTGTSHLDLENINTVKIFDEIETAFAPILSKHSIHLTCCIESFNIYVDKELFKSMIYNILDNAVKASVSDGTIELYAVNKKEFFVITIKDYGIGMNKSDLDRVTEPFYMVDKARSRKNGGAGLGLALCNEIVKCHNGTMKIHSIPSKGTTVTFTIAHKKGDKQ